MAELSSEQKAKSLWWRQKLGKAVFWTMLLGLPTLAHVLKEPELILVVRTWAVGLVAAGLIGIRKG